MMTIREILKKESGLYTAEVDGKSAIIGRDVGNGLTIRMESKPGWDMINEYDEDGYFVGTVFEAQDKEVIE